MKQNDRFEEERYIWLKGSDLTGVICMDEMDELWEGNAFLCWDANYWCMQEQILMSKYEKELERKKIK